MSVDNQKGENYNFTNGSIFVKLCPTNATKPKQVILVFSPTPQQYGPVHVAGLCYSAAAVLYKHLGYC